MRFHVLSLGREGEDADSESSTCALPWLCPSGPQDQQMPFTLAPGSVGGSGVRLFQLSCLQSHSAGVSNRLWKEKTNLTWASSPTGQLSSCVAWGKLLSSLSFPFVIPRKRPARPTRVVHSFSHFRLLFLKLFLFSKTFFFFLDTENHTKHMGVLMSYLKTHISVTTTQINRRELLKPRLPSSRQVPRQDVCPRIATAVN